MNNILKNWKLKKPIAATTAGWREWREENKNKFPVKYFIQETIPRMWDKYILWPISHKIDNMYYWVYYRFTPQGRKLYNIHPRTLTPGFYDYDTLLLHTSFEILVQFVEEDKRSSHVDWNADARHRKFKNEVNALYHWWTKVYPNRENLLPQYPTRPKKFKDIFLFLDEKFKNDPYAIKHREISIKRGEMEDQWIKEDEKMLIRLIKIRKGLWL